MLTEARLELANTDLDPKTRLSFPVKPYCIDGSSTEREASPNAHGDTPIGKSPAAETVTNGGSNSLWVGYVFGAFREWPSRRSQHQHWCRQRQHQRPVSFHCTYFFFLPLAVHLQIRLTVAPPSYKGRPIRTTSFDGALRVDTGQLVCRGNNRCDDNSSRRRRRHG